MARPEVNATPDSHHEDEANLRPCCAEEAEGVLLLWRQAEATVSLTDTVADIRLICGADTADLIVAEVRGKLVGSVVGGFDGWRGNIYRLAVHPDFRRRGVARALVTEVERLLRRRGAKRITALVEKDHVWATEFWQAVGYASDARMARFVRNLEE